jgi:integrase
MLATCCTNEEVTGAINNNISLYRKKWYYHYYAGEDGPEERINLPDFAATAMSEYVSSRGRAAGPEEPLFTSLSKRSSNSRLTLRGLREILSARVKSCGLMADGAVPRPSLIRDTSACLMARSGKPPEFLMKRLGIKNKQSVMKYYGSL